MKKANLICRICFIITVSGVGLIHAFSVTAATPVSSHAVVMLYHHDAVHTPASTTIHPGKFQEHMDHLARESFNVWPLPKVLDFIKQGKDLPDKVVVLTFDDGYRDLYINAYPVMKQKGFPFTAFINSGPIDAGKGNYLSWDQVREMAKHGATIANHTVSHTHMGQPLKGENQGEWLARIRVEVESNQKRIQEETGTDVKILAYPYGEYTPEIIDLVDAMGYTAFGMNSGAMGPDDDSLALPRFAEGGHYVGINDFKLRVKTRSLPVSDIKTGYAVVTTNNRSPTLAFTLKKGRYRYKEMTCYGMGQGRLKVRVDTSNTETGPSFLITPNKPIPVGRSTYNCTMPDYHGRYYWYSHQWNRAKKDGTLVRD